MIGKEKIKFVRSLHQKKFRQKYNKFIAESAKIIGESIAFCPDQIEAIYGLPSYLQTLDIQESTLNEKLIEVDPSQLRKISTLENPVHGVAVIRMEDPKPISKTGDALYLDGIQIPNNVGAILRIAEWYGIENILLSPDTADIYNPKVIQASMGSFFRLNFQIIPVDQLSAAFPQHEIVVADGSGSSLKEFSFPERTILVMGNEGHGPSQAIIDIAKSVIRIDRKSKGTYPESLNVGVATGIICSFWKA